MDIKLELKKKNLIAATLAIIVVLAAVCIPRARAQNTTYSYSISLTSSVQLKSSSTTDSVIISDWKKIMEHEAINIFANEMLSYGFYYQLSSIATTMQVTREPYYVSSGLFSGTWQADVSSNTIVTYISNAKVPDGYVVPIPNLGTTAAQVNPSVSLLAMSPKARITPVIGDEIPSEEEAASTLQDLVSFFVNNARTVIAFASFATMLALAIIIAVTVISIVTVVVRIAAGFDPFNFNPNGSTSWLFYILIFAAVAFVFLYFLGGGKKRRR